MLGMSRVPIPKFVLLNAVGALLWATAVGTGGYLFGNALEILIGDIKHYEIRVFAFIALVGIIIWGFHFYQNKRGKSGTSNH